MFIAHTEEYKGYTIEIAHDEWAENPRSEDYMTLFGTFYGKASNRHFDVDDDLEKFTYNLPEKAQASLPALLDYLNTVGVAIPVYAYVHSGVSLSTANTYPYNDVWDGGCAGVMFADRAKVLENFLCKRITPKIRERAINLLKAEIETYSYYLEGNVYGYIIKDENGEDCAEVGTSVWGYYGAYGSEEWNYMLSEARDQVDWLIEDRAKKAHDDLNSFASALSAFEAAELVA